MRPATCSVGLVSPRSTWLSIGARDAGALARGRAARAATPRAARGCGARAERRTSSVDCTLSRTRLICKDAAPLALAPDVLVLGAGGTLGIAWLRGLIPGLEESAGLDLRALRVLRGDVGRARTSPPTWRPADAADARGSGAPMPPRSRTESSEERPAAPRRRRAAPAGRRADRPRRSRSRCAHARPAAPPLARPAEVSAPAGAGRRWTWARTSRSSGRFDGRLRIATVDRATGKRVVFGSPARPPPPWPRPCWPRARCRGCSPPVEIGGREYVDGGVWSMSNLDAAPAGRRARCWRCCRHSAARGRGTAGVAARRRPGGRARRAAGAPFPRRAHPHRLPGCRDRGGDGPDLMDPSFREPVAAAGRAQGLRLGTKS